MYISVLILVTSYIHIVTSQCVQPGNIELSLQERLYQADIVLYGKDTARDGRCPFGNVECANAAPKYREYSNFIVYCVLKNDGPPVPQNITILPRSFGMPCSQTSFSEGVSGWVHIVTVQYENGRYYWDEVNNMAAYSTVYVLNTDKKIVDASRLCNLPPPMLPVGGSEVGCPAVFNRTRNPATCFKGCERGWTPVGNSCYWFSDPDLPVTRNEAAAGCLLRDSHLLAIETQQEETLLTYVLNDHVDTEWWSGAIYRAGSWLWQDGLTDPSLTFTKWRRGEPAGRRGDTDFVVVLYRRDKWGWRAVNGEAVFPFICEKERGERPPVTLAVCQDVDLQSTQQGRALCSLAVQKSLLTRSVFWPNVTSRMEELCLGKTAYDDINCLRDVRRGENFVTHLLGRANFNPYLPRKELALTFASLPGSLLVCGQHYSWPRTVVVAPHIGDQKTYDSWYFREQSKMAARWEADPGELYALIILDLGLMAVHGAWVNIPGGNLTDGQVLQEYVPLAVVTPEIPATFAFVVYRQKGSAFLTDAILKMLTYSPGRHDDFNLTRLAQEIGFEDLVAVNFVTVTWDPYSAWYYQQIDGYSSHCPHYVTLAYRDLDLPIMPASTPLSLVLDVTFTAGKESWTMCCQQFTVGETTATLNPYGSDLSALSDLTTKDVRLAPSINMTRGNVLLDGRDRRQIFRASCVFGKNQPLVPIDCSLPEPVDMTYDWYMMVMVDLGVIPNAAPPTTPLKPLLHWLVFDIPDGDVTSGKTVVPYKTPAPLDKYKHFYVIYIFKQEIQLGVVNVQKFSTENCTSAVRCPFNLTNFIQFYNMQLAGANWFSVEADTYAIYDLIQAKLASPADACRRKFPETRTYGPLVICETPPPQQPSVRPIISAATWLRPPTLGALLYMSYLTLRYFL